MRPSERTSPSLQRALREARRLDLAVLLNLLGVVGGTTLLLILVSSKPLLESRNLVASCAAVILISGVLVPFWSWTEAKRILHRAYGFTCLRCEGGASTGRAVARDATKTPLDDGNCARCGKPLAPI